MKTIKNGDEEKRPRNLGRDTTLTVMLSKLLADTYILALKTQGFHWNVTGRSFAELHQLFEVQYRDLYTAGDEIAERLRALKMPAPGSYVAFKRLATIREQQEDVVPRSKEMVGILVKDNEQMSRLCAQVVNAAAAVNDIGTADLATRRAQLHDKAAWMLRATNEDEIGAEAR